MVRFLAARRAIAWYGAKMEDSSTEIFKCEVRRSVVMQIPQAELRGRSLWTALAEGKERDEGHSSPKKRLRSNVRPERLRATVGGGQRRWRRHQIRISGWPKWLLLPLALSCRRGDCASLAPSTARCRCAREPLAKIGLQRRKRIADTSDTLYHGLQTLRNTLRPDVHAAAKASGVVHLDEGCRDRGADGRKRARRGGDRRVPAPRECGTNRRSGTHVPFSH
eukprot:scaffold280794_cov27-Tisochrysis_lutea.AAC.2